MWTKNGSIPQAETDGTEGWLEVPDMPVCPEGKEVVWLNWEWVIRDPKPDDRDGYRWKWNHDAYQWIEYALPATVDVLPAVVSEQIEFLASTDLASLTTSQISAL